MQCIYSRLERCTRETAQLHVVFFERTSIANDTQINKHTTITKSQSLKHTHTHTHMRLLVTKKGTPIQQSHSKYTKKQTNIKRRVHQQMTECTFMQKSNMPNKKKTQKYKTTIKQIKQSQPWYKHVTTERGAQIITNKYE